MRKLCMMHIGELTCVCLDELTVLALRPYAIELNSEKTVVVVGVPALDRTGACRANTCASQKKNTLNATVVGRGQLDFALLLVDLDPFAE